MTRKTPVHKMHNYCTIIFPAIFAHMVL